MTLVIVPACVVLCLWQYHRARSGNTLSWAYVFEWPILGTYAAYMWWKLTHEELRRSAAPSAGTALADPEAGTTGPADPVAAGVPSATTPTPAAEPDAEVAAGAVVEATARAAPDGQQEADDLAAYNRYLAELHAHGPPKRW